MCGIAGLIGLAAGREQLARMLALMRHRGPDGEGMWQDAEADLWLGHRRLAIIDLSTGDQPMESADKRFVLTFNGEIYNYRELRPDLERRGYPFRTTSDTEVLLAGLALEGPAFLRKTIGMFAFALWDRRERTLLLARDRVGVKPLYYAEPKHGGLAFASEVKSLLGLEGVSREIDGAALDAYLALRYVPAPLTMIAGVKKFPPGHYAVFKDGELSFTRYWDVSFDSGGGERMDEREARDELIALLKDSVRLRLRSDVPFGAFLSGGLDSALIVGLMAQTASERVRTYSIGFEGVEDERPQARAIAKAAGADHTEFALAPQDLARLPEVAWYLDEPFPDPIVLAMSLLAERARSTVKVILTGEGSDEIFAGYVHHPHLHLLSRAAPWVPESLFRLGAFAASRVPVALLDRLFDYPTPPREKGRERLAGLLRAARHESARYLAYVSLFTEDERRRVLSPAARASVESPWSVASTTEARFENLENDLPIDRIWTLEYQTWLPDNILFKQDKTLMSHGIEGRVPYCDHRLVEFAAKLPLRSRLSHGRNKVLLRDAASKIFPDLPPMGGKKAFVVPLDGAYGAVIRELAGDVLTGSRFRSLGLFDNRAVETLLGEFPNPSFLVGRQIMALVMFALWHEGVMGAPAPAAVPAATH
jgi:asparagine synthase (glutamine-hydrolysing)